MKVSSNRKDSVFSALADPTRRAMIERLREREKSAAELGEPFKISQPAVSQHLKVLADAGLVKVRREGRRKMFRLHAAAMREAFDWLQRYEKLWSASNDTNVPTHEDT